MKFTRIMAIVLSVLMVVFAFASCDKGGDANAETTVAEDTTPNVTLTVSIKVKDLDGKVVYEAAKYIYSGKAPTPIELIDDYFYMEIENETVELDEVGEIVSIGSVSCGEVTAADASSFKTYWWWTLNGKDSNNAMSEYTVQNGDAIEFYLKKLNG